MARSFAIPSSPEDRKKIMDAMLQISAAMTRKSGESDYIKETLKKLAEDFQIPKKYLAEFAKWYHKDALKEARETNAEFEDLVDALVPPAEGDE